ncbi:MAG: hypothetical protein K9M97_01820 [Akkermansiaceae bacterium]|nr:hypothetical protein [Akkermansiaceae bacterium]
MNPRRHTTFLATLVASWWRVPAGAAGGQGTQLENSFRNILSGKGAPTAPSPPPSPTPNQWNSGTAFSGWQTTVIRDAARKVLAGTPNVDVYGRPIKGPGGQLILPANRAKDGSLPPDGRQLQMAKIGRPIVLRQVTIPLGSLVERPDRQPNGAPIPPDDPNFYLPEPWNSIAGNADPGDPRIYNGAPVSKGRFYWSPHAQSVFATEPGQVTVIWKLRTPANGIPDDPENFVIRTVSVSGSPVKSPRRLFWTERGFKGPVVDVPAARVGQVSVVYTSAFPREVAVGQDYQTLHDPPVDPNVALPPERRTLWYDSLDHKIHAYNVEGRVFVELLGDLREPERIYREHLGFEIVDVIKEVRPEELRVSIGEQVHSVDEAALTPEEEALVPAVVAGSSLGADPYLYEHVILGGTKRLLYAIKETTPLRILDLNDDGVIDGQDEQQSNEVLIYWKEEGAMQLLWPKRYVGYIFKWPEDYLANPTQSDLREFYAIYARPEGSDPAAMEATGVQLNSGNNPVLTYQDDLTRQHAQLTALNVFYTVPGTGSRSLIRYTKEGEIWFERVYSIPNGGFDDYNTTTPATVGSRIEPPDGIASTVGYIRQTQGDAFNPAAYLDPFVEGFDDAAKGAIIPVNALPSNNILEVWWYERSAPPAGTTAFTPVQWPSYVNRYQLQWPVTDPDDENIYDEIVLARNDGSGYLGIAATGSIYRQPEPALPGYNPNEEHALMSGGVAWALRDDLNLPTSSKPFVLVDYTAEDGRPAMVIRRVVRENDTHTFNYEAPVGVILQAPMPLPVIPLPLDTNGKTRNVEVGAPTDVPATYNEQTKAGVEHYDRFTYVDRKGSTWIYRGPHGEGVNEGTTNDLGKNFRMHYFYKTQAEFDFPGLTPPVVGTIVPYLRPFTNGIDPSDGFSGNPITGDPLEIAFIPVWPANPPVLGIAESLGLPKRGLPAVRGQTSARLLYQQSIAADLHAKTPSATLFDPTRAKVYQFSATGLAKIPDSVVTSDYLGKTYFPNLPPHLSRRLFYDPNIGGSGALVFVGEFVDAPFGEDYFLLNVMSDKDVADAKALVHVTDADKSKWAAAIDGLATTLETFKEDPVRRGTYIVDPSRNVTVGPQQIAQIVSDDTAVDSYAASAAGGGTGFVVMAAGDGDASTPPAEPVSLEVFKVAPPLYRGELKIVESANPLDEKLTLQHSGDFAGEPGDYEFAWITGQPVAGFPPTLYTFTGLEVFGNGTGPSWTLLNSPQVAAGAASALAGYKAARSYTFDDSAWELTGNLSANEIIINDGTSDQTTTEAGVRLVPDAVLRDTLVWAGGTPIDLYLSLNIADNDGAVVYLNGAEIAVWNVPGRADSVPTTAPGTIAGNTLPLVFAVPPETLQARNTITVELYTSADPGTASFFDLRLDSQQETENITGWQEVTTGAKSGLGEGGKLRHTIEGASILTLTDNYFTMRYRAKQGTAAAAATGGGATTPGEWARWMPPQLAEGWIKRVLAGINPFDQRVTDLFSNTVNTDVSLLTQAGPRWEGNVALNLANINDFGLIEIYETVLNRGKELSIAGAPPLNVPAANDALLLAAGYLSDLYLLHGNEGYADAANPTIAFDTAAGGFGEFNTALFSFKGQVPTVLEEELALVRGRDDSLQPGVAVAPIYNRLVWNFTGGINSGEPIYSLNYNIQDQNVDGAADAADAAVQYPQGHGDAYGHYLTALTVYYGLLNNPHFAWTPRIEAVSVLGQPVSIDYQDERRFAAAAAALARTASQTLDLTYRKEFNANPQAGWRNLRDGKVNSRSGTTRYWGTDEWASRAGQGAYFHWVTANSVLPEEDTVHDGIQKVDRSTVPELDEVVAQAESIQSTLDNADNRLNPLGLAGGALSFDISPSEIDKGNTHYEQVFDRAIGALRNAEFAFDNAKRSTAFLRQQENSVADQRAAIEAQEQAFENQLIELYGTPYPDDIGPGRTYPQGYAGPDLLHFGYIETPELFFDPSLESAVYELPVAPDYKFLEYGELQLGATISYQLNERGEMVKPPSWTGQRAHPGTIQTKTSDFFAARQRVSQTLESYKSAVGDMVEDIEYYNESTTAHANRMQWDQEVTSEIESFEAALRSIRAPAELTQLVVDTTKSAAEAVSEGFPKVVGVASDATSAGRAAALAAGSVSAAASVVEQGISIARELGLVDEIGAKEDAFYKKLEETAWQQDNQQTRARLRAGLTRYAEDRLAIDKALRELDQATRDLQAVKAQGLAIQAERLTFRKRAAAIVQGYRTRDLAFRVFRNEALEKYKALFDLAARYTFLAASAYDYETGLLDYSGSSAAAGFFEGIVQSRALGVVDANGNPQFTASTTGDPGLAGVMAQMQADWSVAKTRLGFNNPDRYRTVFSLRGENFRIIPSAAGNGTWQDKLASCLLDNVLEDPDVKRYAMQIANHDGLPVPGLVIPFQTTIAEGFNFFGQQLAGGDHGFSPTSFATKIRASGIAFAGYIGMDDPTSIGGEIGGIGGSTPPDPDLGFLDPDALSATPYIYLIPVGIDSMRSPPLGDVSKVRSWTVNDQAIPLPFNIGNTDFSENAGFLSGDSLSEEPFAIRKHQAFRAVPAGTVFGSAPGFTNSRLIGRSVWNSQWKIIIPGKTLHANPDVGLQIFLETVKDVQLFLETYSYSGN